MSVADNKELIRSACRFLSERNVPALLELMHPQGSWSIPYRSDRFQFGGFRDRAALGELLTTFLGGFTEFSFTPTSITAEEDRVAVEAKSAGIGVGGANYENVYSFIFFIKDGKIHTAREYFDPFQVLAYVEQWPK